MSNQTLKARGETVAVPGSLWKHSGLAVSLALVSGYVDAYSYLSYKLYSSFMSGNTTQTGLRLGEGETSVAAHHLLAIASFVVGVFSGTLLLHSRLQRPIRWLFAVCAGLLALSLVGVLTGTLSGDVAFVFLAVAMGAMNTSVTRVGKQTVHLGYVSGTLNGVAQHLALALKGAPVSDAEGAWDTNWRRAALLGTVWFGFMVGALLGAVGQINFQFWTLLLPIVLLIALAMFDRVKGAAT